MQSRFPPPVEERAGIGRTGASKVCQSFSQRPSSRRRRPITQRPIASQATAYPASSQDSLPGLSLPPFSLSLGLPPQMPGAVEPPWCLRWMGHLLAHGEGRTSWPRERVSVGVRFSVNSNDTSEPSTHRQTHGHTHRHTLTSSGALLDS